MEDGVISAQRKDKSSSHSRNENTKRAYIAASRRRDRNINARVKSAQMASKVHKRQTGRALHITRNIVLNEELYEEEDDNVFAPVEMHNYVSPTVDHAYTAGEEASSKLYTYTLINRLFEQVFCHDLNGYHKRSETGSEEQKCGHLPPPHGSTLAPTSSPADNSKHHDAGRRFKQTWHNGPIASTVNPAEASITLHHMASHHPSMPQLNKTPLPAQNPVAGGPETELKLLPTSCAPEPGAVSNHMNDGMTAQDWMDMTDFWNI